MKRKIAVVTGIRSEYDLLYSVLKAIDEHPNLELNLIVTGAHLSEKFGSTVKEIEKDGFNIVARLDNLLNTDTLASRAKSASIQMHSLIGTVERIKPDILLVLGDREESVTTALTGVYMNIPVAHIFGGDRVRGNVDDTVRHAVTKLAHIHFPVTEENAQRIIKMGEEPWRVHCVGNPGLDRILNTDTFNSNELSKRIGFDVTEGPLILLIQHPLSSEYQKAGEQMRITMDALRELKYRTLINYPNSDAGGREIISVINKCTPKMPYVKVFKNLSRKEFVSLLHTVDVLIGNSSCGIMEAPLLKLPVVNIGKRQTNRQHADNVMFVKNDKEEIVRAVKTAVLDKDFKSKVKNCVNPYGDGRTGPRVAKVLAEIELGEKLINKNITY